MSDMAQPKAAKTKPDSTRKKPSSGHPVTATPDISQLDQQETITPELVLQLQHTVGNTALRGLLGRQQQSPQTGMLIQRADKEEANTLTDALALVDAEAPLHKLNTELAKPAPNVDDCLTLINLLGAGQRKIVGNDEGQTGLMRKLAKAMTDVEMLTVVRALGPANVAGSLGLAWALYWILESKEGGGANIGDTAFEEFIMGSSKEAVVELLDVTLTLKKILAHYKRDLLGLITLKIGAPELITALGFWADEITDLLFTKDQPTAMSALHYIAANDPKGISNALHAKGKWVKYVQLLRYGQALSSPEKSAFHTIFLAMDDVEQRKPLYERRFVNPSMTDWPGTDSGAGAWQARETEETQKAEAGREEEYTTGGSWGRKKKTKTRTISLWKDFSTALKDKSTSAVALRNIVVRMTDEQRAKIVGSSKTMSALQTRLVGDKSFVPRFLRLLNITGIAAIKFIHKTQMGTAGALDVSVYNELLRTSTTADIQAMLASSKYRAIITAQPLNPLLIPCLSAPAQLAAVIRDGEHFVNWVLAKAGSDLFLQHMSTGNPRITGNALSVKDTLWPLVINPLQAGAALSPATQKAMFTLFDTINSINVKLLLAKKRFNFQSLGKEGATDWEATGLKQAWILMERLPPEHVSENAWFRALNRTGKDDHSGVTGGNRVGIEYDQDNMGQLDSGEFTDDTDILRGKNLFDSVVIHEIGHAVDFEKDYSGALSLLQTDDDMGAWNAYSRINQIGNAEALLTDMLGDAGEALPVDVDESKYTKMILANAIATHKSPRDIVIWIRDNDPLFTGSAGNRNWLVKLFNDDVKDMAVAENIRKYGDEDTEPWNTSYTEPLGDRAYHSGYKTEWSSYKKDARGAIKISKYQFRDHMEFFAETYATFYLTPTDPGKLLRDANLDDLYNWFVKHVDKGYSTQFKEN